MGGFGQTPRTLCTIRVKSATCLAATRVLKPAALMLKRAQSDNRQPTGRVLVIARGSVVACLVACTCLGQVTHDTHST